MNFELKGEQQREKKNCAVFFIIYDIIGDGHVDTSYIGNVVHVIESNSYRKREKRKK